MKYPKPSKLTNGELDRAGDILRVAKPKSEEYKSALREINIWRQSHFYPMNTFQATLRRFVKNLPPSNNKRLVAQRLKRMPSIIQKLNRNGTDKMELHRMQDVGGLRAILNSVDEVYEIFGKYMTPDCKPRDNFSSYEPRVKDYIKNPKSSGYRGIHLVFTYDNRLARGEAAARAKLYKGLHIEIQLRTQLQHFWATAVETVGMMNRENLKSSIGDKEWLDFFETVSEIFATMEHFQSPKMAQITNNEQNFYENLAKLKKYNKDLDILNKLGGWGEAAEFLHQQKIIDKKVSYVIISLNLDDEKKSVIYGFSENETDKAVKKYAELENSENQARTNQVLVSAGRMKNLRAAYPNYFLDIRHFAKLIETMIESLKEI